MDTINLSRPSIKKVCIIQKYSFQKKIVDATNIMDVSIRLSRVIVASAVSFYSCCRNKDKSFTKRKGFHRGSARHCQLCKHLCFQNFTFRGFSAMVDPRFQWNVSASEGIREIAVKSSAVWQPDVYPCERSHLIWNWRSFEALGLKSSLLTPSFLR